MELLLESVLVSGKVNRRSLGIYIDNDLEVVRVKVTSDLKEELQQKAKELDKRNIEELLLYAAQKIIRQTRQANKTGLPFIYIMK